MCKCETGYWEKYWKRTYEVKTARGISELFDQILILRQEIQTLYATHQDSCDNDKAE